MSKSLEYRHNASRCADLAHTAQTPQVKQTLIELSQNWLHLSIQTERTQSLLDEWFPDHDRVD
jgi:hypothetical protein